MKMIEVKDLNIRLARIEGWINKLIGGAAVASVLLLGYFGFTTFKQIPAAIKAKLPEAVGHYIDANNPNFIEEMKAIKRETLVMASESNQYLEQAKQSYAAIANLEKSAEAKIFLSKVDSGELDIYKGNIPSLMRSESGNRGVTNGSVQFTEPFNSIPTVVAGITHLDIIDGSNNRLNISISDISETGFKYKFYTWNETKVWRAKANWMAVGK